MGVSNRVSSKIEASNMDIETNVLMKLDDIKAYHIKSSHASKFTKLFPT